MPMAGKQEIPPHSSLSAPPHRSYVVGRGRPPEHSRFKPGQSGNLSGRPRRRPSPQSVLNSVLAGYVDLREGAKTKRITKYRAIFEMAVNKALKGNGPCLR